ncbi:hypothetical protein [Cupriavidus sp. TMH.W2]|uniref:hypothetical protein n=1 Tax=Cupriavidus sp. TMH.W2 TaxID=3434465 RepID=UPI003D788A90
MQRSGTQESHPYSVARRLADPAHERMLYALHRDLPGRPWAAIDETDALNATIRDHRAELDVAVSEVIREVPIESPEEVRVWQRVPAVQFPVATRPVAPVVLGVPLQSELDQHGKRRARPERLDVCDFSFTIHTWLWDKLALHSVDRNGRRRPLQTPEAAFDISWRDREITFFGNVYPRGCPLGAVAEHFAHLQHAVAVLRAERKASDEGRDATLRTLLVTDDADLYGVFMLQAFAVLYQHESLEQDNLDRLAWSLHGHSPWIDLSVRWTPYGSDDCEPPPRNS